MTFFKPGIILFVGVAGGFKTKDVTPGDVVVASKVYGYESGKAEANDFKTRPEVFRPGFKLLEIAKFISRSHDWFRYIPDYSTKVKPKAVPGPVAAGNKVITSKKSEIGQLILNHYNDTTAVEMEGMGFLGASYANPDVQALLIRGISDLLDNKDEADSKGFQEIASKHAAAFAFEVLNKKGKVDKEDNEDKEEKKRIKSIPPGPVVSDPMDNALRDIRKTVGREKELKQLLDALELKDKKVFIVNGLAGIGKSILVSKLLQHKENPYLQGEFFVIDCRTYKTFTDIFRRFSRLFQYHKNGVLAQLLETYSHEHDADKLSEQIVSHLGKWLLVFDNFEDLLQKSHQSEDTELEEDGVPIEDICLRTFFEYLFTLRHDARVIITTRFIPRLPDYQNYICYPLKDEINERLTGLTSGDLREYASKQEQSFTGEEWELIDQKIDGHPQAFEFLCSLLRSKRKLNAIQLLKPGRVTRYKSKIQNELLGKLLEILEKEEREILDIICLLRKPFTVEVVDYLLKHRGKTIINLEEWLFRLDDKSLLEPNINDTLSMHAVVRDGVSAALQPDEKDSLHRVSADYYVDTVPSKIKKLEDVEALEEAYYHYTEAQLEEEAEVISNKLGIVLQKIGFVNYLKSKWEDSARALELRIKHDEEDWRLYFYLGNIFLKQRKPIDEVVFIFEKALRYNRDDFAGKAKILQSFGVALKTYKRYEDAFKRFEQSLEIEPQNSMTLQAYGIALKEAKQYENAEKMFKQSLAIDGDNLFTLQEYAILLRLMQHYLEAEDIFKSIPEDKMDIPAKTEYARTLISQALQQKNKEKSKLYFDKARSLLINITSKDEVIYTELARMEGFIGNHDEKIKILTGGLNAYPNSLFLLQELGNTYKKMMYEEKESSKRKEYFETAQKYYNKIIDEGKADYIVHSNYAKLLKGYAVGLNFKQRDIKDRYYDLAEEQFKKALELEENSRNHAELGNLLRFRKSKQGEAEKHLKKATELDESSYFAQVEYACFLLSRGKEEESLHHYQKALALAPKKNRPIIEKKYKITRLKLKKKGNCIPGELESGNT